MAHGRGTRAQRAATIVDVARRAGVSFKTVSRVLNDESHVREATRTKVIEAVEALGYRTNHNARNLRARQSRLIAILFSNASRNYLGEVQWGALRRCQSEGYNLISEDWAGVKQEWLALKPETDLAGIILTPPLSDDLHLIAELEARELPHVRISAAEDRQGSCSVGIDDEAAAIEMVDYLVGLGHRRIGFIAGTAGHSQARKRLDGYKEGLAKHGLPQDDRLIVQGSFHFTSGLAAADWLMDLTERPTAIFAANDDMAAGALAVAYRRRIAIPDDLSVVGFDDTPLASTISPALTTIYQPSLELASEAVGLLIQRINQPVDPPSPCLLDYKLVIRGSAGAPPKSRA